MSDDAPTFNFTSEEDSAFYGNIDDDADFAGSQGYVSDLSANSDNIHFVEWATPPSPNSRSVTESIYDFPVEHGRTYHKFREGKYVLPNDPQEQQRLNRVHGIFKLLLRGRLFLAPIENPKRVIDLGTGTGVWAIEMGDKFPDAQIIGTDLSPIQPEYVPLNVRFEIDDITDDWAWDKNFFDFVHCRTLVGSIEDWEAFAKNIYEHTTPGGWFEVQEYDIANPQSEDNSLDPNGELSKFFALMVDASVQAGKPLNFAPKIRECFQKAGFKDVVEKRTRYPLGGWARDPRMQRVGMTFTNFSKAMEAYSLALFTRVLKMKEEEVRDAINRAVEDASKPGTHIFWNVYFIYGRKPAESDKPPSN